MLGKWTLGHLSLPWGITRPPNSSSTPSLSELGEEETQQMGLEGWSPDPRFPTTRKRCISVCSFGSRQVPLTLPCRQLLMAHLILSRTEAGAGLPRASVTCPAPLHPRLTIHTWPPWPCPRPLHTVPLLRVIFCTTHSLLPGSSPLALRAFSEHLISGSTLPAQPHLYRIHVL